MKRKMFLSLAITVLAAVISGGIAYATGVVHSNAKPAGAAAATHLPLQTLAATKEPRYAPITGSTAIGTGYAFESLPDSLQYDAAVAAAGAYSNIPTRQYLAAISGEQSLKSYNAAVAAAGSWGNVPTLQYLRAISANPSIHPLG